MNPDEHTPTGESCPKRLWVLLTLSDDGLVSEDGQLPAGLRSHLSRCESCRILADRLLSVSGELRDLSALEPEDELAEAAKAQAMEALRSGARLTGRVDVHDEPDLPVAGPTALRWRRFAGHAAAAVILLAVGVSGLLWIGRQDQLTRPPRPGVEGSYAPNDRLAAESDKPPVGAGQEAEATSKEQLVDSGGSDRPTKHPRRIRRHHSHIEAALSDDPSGAQAAVVLPDPARREIGWGKVFDKPRIVVSTTSSDD